MDKYYIDMSDSNAYDIIKFKNKNNENTVDDTCNINENILEGFTNMGQGYLNKCCPTGSVLNNNNESLIINELKEIIKKQQEQLTKQQEQISELIPKIGNNTINNTINNNNNFNINLFLNEHCKDAITIEEFVKNVQISLNNLLTTKNKGLTIGINEIINENMNKLSIYERPIHCTDKKRETLYVKHDKWEKDVNKESTTKMLKDLQLQQLKNLHKWVEAHPNYKEDDDLKVEYNLLINKCTKPLSEHEKKLFKNICDNTYVKDENLIE